MKVKSLVVLLLVAVLVFVPMSTVMAASFSHPLSPAIFAFEQGYGILVEPGDTCVSSYKVNNTVVTEKTVIEGANVWFIAYGAAGGQPSEVGKNVLVERTCGTNVSVNVFVALVQPGKFYRDSQTGLQITAGGTAVGVVKNTPNAFPGHEKDGAGVIFQLNGWGFGTQIPDDMWGKTTFWDYAKGVFQKESVWGYHTGLAMRVGAITFDSLTVSREPADPPEKDQTYEWNISAAANTTTWTRWSLLEYRYTVEEITSGGKKLLADHVVVIDPAHFNVSWTPTTAGNRTIRTTVELYDPYWDAVVSSRQLDIMVTVKGRFWLFFPLNTGH